MTAAPTSPHMARYRTGPPDDTGDGRLHSPVFLRNAPPLIATFADLFRDRTGPVLEIGAGTGQHASAFALAFPDLDWWPSDPDPLHRASIAAWATFLRAPERAPFAIDASTDWAAEIAHLGPLTAVISLNVIHISPIAVLHGILDGAAQALGPDGFLAFYGPFTEDGAHTGPGNATFDANLRAENPEWGIRDISDIAQAGADLGFGPHSIRPMPANNRLLILPRQTRTARV